MKEITIGDLKEALTILLPQKHADGEGGWREIWEKGPLVWASVWPLFGEDRFQKEDRGGPMASQKGYIKTLPPSRYRLTIRAGVVIPLKTRFLWHLRDASKYLSLTSTPVLLQYNRFLSMTVVEELNA